MSTGKSDRKFSVKRNMCKACEKAVYDNEQIIIDSVIYHKNCFKCCHCKSILNVGNYASGSIGGDIYCKVHFLQVFKLKGTYEITKNDAHIIKASELSEEAKEQIKTLDDFLSKGYLTQDEYNTKKKSVIESSKQPDENTKQTDSPTTELQKLDEYLKKGYLTKEEYEMKKKSLDTTPNSNYSDDQKEQLKKLEEYRQKGYINDQEFETKKKEIVGVDYSKKVIEAVNDLKEEKKIIQPVKEEKNC